MGEQWSIPAWAAIAVGVLLLLALLAVALVGRALRSARRTDAARAAARDADLQALGARLAAVEAERERRVAAPADEGFVITRLGDDVEPDRSPVPVVPVVPAAVFTDLVLREGVVQAASIAAGVRRALAPETRARIRIAMRREIKQARRRRKDEVRAARRHLADVGAVPVSRDDAA